MTTVGADHSPDARGPQKLLPGGFQYGTVFVLLRLLRFLVVPVMASKLTTEQFGVYGIAVAIIGVAGLLLDMGCGVALVRQAAGADPAHQLGVFATTFWWRVSSFLFTAVLLVAGGGGLWASGCSLLSRSTAELGILSFFWLWTGMAWRFTFEVQRAKGKHSGAALSLAVQMLTWAATAVVFLLSDGELVGVFWAHILGNLVSLLVGVRAVPGRVLTTKPRLDLFRQQLTFGLPVSMTSLLGAVAGLDRILVGRFTSTVGAGYYHMATMPADAVSLVNQTAQSAAEPLVFSAPPERVVPQVQRLVRHLGFAILSVTLTGALVAPEAFLVLVPLEYVRALPAVSWLLGTAAMDAMFNGVGLGAAYANQTRILTKSRALGLLVTLPLLVGALDQGLGLAGAAMARFVGATVGVLACHHLTRRVFGRGLGARRFVLSAVLVVLGGATCIGLPWGPEPALVRVGVWLMVMLGVTRLMYGSIRYFIRPTSSR